VNEVALSIGVASPNTRMFPTVGIPQRHKADLYLLRERGEVMGERMFMAGPGDLTSCVKEERVCSGSGFVEENG
jgi:hypothetical protein